MKMPSTPKRRKRPGKRATLLFNRKMQSAEDPSETIINVMHTGLCEDGMNDFRRIPREIGIQYSAILVDDVVVYDCNIFHQTCLENVTNYVQYSAVCARVIRQCLKPELRVEALKRDESIVKLTKWEGGKPIIKTEKSSG